MSGKRVEPWKRLLFLSSLGLIVIAFNFRHFHGGVSVMKGKQDSSVSQPLISPQEEVAKKRLRKKERYVTREIYPTPGKKCFVLAITSPRPQEQFSWIPALSQTLQAQDSILIEDLFSHEFFESEDFSRLLNGSRSPLREFGLDNLIDVLVAGRQSVHYVTNSQLENVITANLNLKLVSLAANGTSQFRQFNANGAGFTIYDAQALAAERLGKQISKDSIFHFQKQ